MGRWFMLGPKESSVDGVRIHGKLHTCRLVLWDSGSARGPTSRVVLGAMSLLAHNLTARAANWSRSLPLRPLRPLNGSQQGVKPSPRLSLNFCDPLNLSPNTASIQKFEHTSPSPTITHNHQPRIVADSFIGHPDPNVAGGSRNIGYTKIIC